MSEIAQQKDDIDRMIGFIEHEATQLLHELRIRGVEDYNSEKAKIVNLKSFSLKKTYEKKEEEIESDFLSKVSGIKNAKNQEILKKKRKILHIVFNNLIQRLKKENINTRILDSVSEIILKNKNDKMILTVAEKDKNIADKYSEEKYPGRIIVKVSKKDDFLGGVLATSEDTKTVCDNSYGNRVMILWEKHAGEIGRLLNFIE